MANRILVVEDDLDTARTIEKCLRAWGHEVEIVQSGEEAIAAVRRSLPIGMTLGLFILGMSGVEVLRYLRQTGQSLPVVVISGGLGYLNESDLKFVRENAQGVLPKPYDRDEFKALVEQWFEPPPRVGT